MAIFVNAGFDVSSNTILTSYTDGTGETGGPWYAWGGYDSLWVASSTASIYNSISNYYSANYADADPITADYDVVADYKHYNTATHSGVIGRASSSEQTGYIARFYSSKVQVYRVNSGTWNLLATEDYVCVQNQVYRIKLILRDDTIAVEVDDIEIIAAFTDASPITAKGKAGIIVKGQYYPRVDNFEATDAESGSSTISPIKVNAGLVNSSLTVPRLIA